jgi:hypothetical protein
MNKPEPVRNRTDAVESRKRRPRPSRMAAEDVKRWQEENAEAIRSINDWVEKNGLPLDPYRVV